VSDGAAAPDPDRSAASAPLIGVLALQGGFGAHGRVLRELGAHVREVRVPADLEGLDGLVMPGGESTTMTLGIAREGLAEPLRELAARGVPVLGTCAGLIMLDRDHLSVVDLVAERNAFGRQIRSFEADLRFEGLGDEPLRAVFIRAPVVAEHGPAVEILAAVDGRPVAARQGTVMVVAFHPELSRDTRLHRWFLDAVARARVGGASAA
jgi:5'-phosphate synthase pdxT subunit